MKFKKSFWAFLTTLLCAQTASAGSYQLNEYSVTGLGRAFAGAGVVGDDYSAIAFNPAGMSAVKKSEMQLGVSTVHLYSDLDSIDGIHDTKMNHYVSIPNFFAQYKINNRWDFGFGVYVPYGLSTRYKANSFVANSAIKSELQVVDLAPALSYKLTDSLTVGGSFIARYIYGHMTNTISPLAGGGRSDFELDGWTVSGTLGIMYEPIKDTRIGLSWRMKSTQQVKGDHKIENNLAYGGMFNGTYIGRASPNLPETITLSGFTKHGKFGFSGTARWTHWSTSFEKFVMESENPMFATNNGWAKESPYNYDNSWTLTAGVDYYYNDHWTFRFGGGWDESPDHKDTTRTWRIPDNDRWWTSIGASYMRDNWQFDFAYTHMFAKTSYIYDLDNSTGPIAGKMKNLQSSIFGLQAQYHF